MQYLLILLSCITLAIILCVKRYKYIILKKASTHFFVIHLSSNYKHIAISISWDFCNVKEKKEYIYGVAKSTVVLSQNLMAFFLSFYMVRSIIYFAHWLAIP